MGGAAGHMAHLHENIWLTFGEIKSFLRQVASAELNPIEKVDGQNIFFRWSSDGIKTARNMGDITRGGMTEAEYRKKWENHPAEAAFIKGFETIKAAMNKMSGPEAGAAFDTGQPNIYRFVNCEIMLPESENIIMYDGSYIVLHNMKEYAPVGPNGRMIETELFTAGDSEFDSIVQSISDIEKKIDSEEWQVFGPRFVELKNIVDNTAYDNAVAVIDGLGYSDNQPLSDLVKDKLLGELENSGLPSDKIDLLVQRVIQIGEKTPSSELINVNKIKKGLDKTQKSIVTRYGSKAKSADFIGRSVAPFAKAVSDFAIEVLRGLHSFFMTDGDAEVERMRNTLLDSIQKLESYTGPDAEKYGELLQQQLEKLGNIENIASTVEGLIFEYPPGSKKLVKLTGSFAMANQIIGRAKRLPADAPPEDIDESFNIPSDNKFTISELETLYESIADQGFNSVAVIGGAFKPPHLGHVSMVDHYLSLAEKVKIYISAPQASRSQRWCGDVCLTPNISLELWNLLLAGRANVTVEISSSPSPVGVAYDSVQPGHPWTPGTTVYLGASTKGGDINRYNAAKNKAAPDIKVADPATFAAPAAQLPTEYKAKLEKQPFYEEMPSVKKGLDVLDYSASDLRKLLELATTSPAAKDLAGYFVGPQNVSAYMASIGLLEEGKRYNLRYRLYENS